MKYTKPEITIVNFETANIIATSAESTSSSASTLETWGAQIKSVSPDDVINMFK